jgi:hypothetical protein
MLEWLLGQLPPVIKEIFHDYAKIGKNKVKSHSYTSPHSNVPIFLPILNLGTFKKVTYQLMLLTYKQVKLFYTEPFSGVIGMFPYYNVFQKITLVSTK